MTTDSEKDGVEKVEEVIAEEPTEETTEAAEPAETAEETEEKETESIEDLKAQNAKLYSRLKKQEEVNKDLKKSAPPTKEEEAKDTKADDEFRPRVEFLLENRDLNAEEYEHLAAVALRNSGVLSLDSLREAKESEKGYISFLRKKVADKNKTPGSTSQSSTSKFEKTPQEIAKMNSTEHRKYEEQMVKESQGI